MSARPYDEHAQWTPQVNPWIVAASVMLATFMVVLDSSVANVALPHIAGSLSASNDESTWILTSYLVANAIVLPATGWLARRIGRRRLFLISILLFTSASLLCGMASNMPMLILARVLQGAGGGGMLPLAQSILIESFPPQKLGAAMSAYGMGVVVAPIIGPTLGGWITDSYNWRWIFLINLPIGILALFMVNMNVEDPPYLRDHNAGSIDVLGFGLMAVWLGSLQLLLDKGQEADWFGSYWVRWVAALCIAAFLSFIYRELHVRDPIVQLRILKDRNFLLGTLVTAIYGFILYGATAMLPLFLQTLLGYPALQSGLAVSPRGIGALLSMLCAGFLMRHIDGRLLIAFGFSILTVSIWMLSRINLDIGYINVAAPNVLNGFAMGFIFVPLTALAMGHLRKQDIGNASGIYNLMRNIGGSIGIAVIITQLVRRSQVHQNELGASMHGSQLDQMARGITGYLAVAGSDPVTAYNQAYGALYRILQQQAMLLAYVDNFHLLAILGVPCIALALFLRRASKNAAPPESLGD